MAGVLAGFSRAPADPFSLVLAGPSPCVPANQPPRAPADPSQAPVRQEVSTGPRVSTIRSFGDEPLHSNSRHQKIATALVRRFKLLLKGLNVKKTVAAASRDIRRTLSDSAWSAFKSASVRSQWQSIAHSNLTGLYHPLRFHCGVENLLSLGI